MGAGLLLLLVACGDTAGSDESTAVIEEAVVTEPPASLTIALPDNLVPQGVPIFATRSLTIKDRVRVHSKWSGYGTVIATGTTQSNIGLDATTGSVISKPAVIVGARTRVEGSLKSSGAVTFGQGALATGTVQANTPLGPLRSSTFPTAVPARAFGNQDVQPDTTVTLAPGGYGFLAVKSRAQVHLSAGAYSFDSLQVESQGKLVIDDAAGPVVVHVRGTVTYRGTIVEKTDPASNDVDLLIIAYGSTTSFVEAPYKGTLFVPSGSLTLQPLNGAQHFGAFFARNLLVEAGVIIRHQPFPWSKLLPPTGIIMTESPIALRPTLVGGAGGSGGSAGGTGGSAGSGGSEGRELLAMPEAGPPARPRTASRSRTSPAVSASESPPICGSRLGTPGMARQR
jgi:hypothetical protein